MLNEIWKLQLLPWWRHLGIHNKKMPLEFRSGTPSLIRMYLPKRSFETKQNRFWCLAGDQFVFSSLTYIWCITLQANRKDIPLMNIEKLKSQEMTKSYKIDQTYEKIWPLSFLSSATAAKTPRKIPMSKDRVEEVRGLGSNVLGDQKGQKPGDLEQSETKRDTKTIHSFMTRLFLCFFLLCFQNCVVSLWKLHAHMDISSSLWDIWSFVALTDMPLVSISHICHSHPTTAMESHRKAYHSVTALM